MNFKLRNSIFLIFFVTFLSAFIEIASAQEASTDSHVQKIRGAIMMANTHVPNAVEGGRFVAVMPTWGFDVDYYFHPRWSVALQGDIMLQSFEVEDGESVLKRTNPFALAIVMHYHALKHWSFFIGPGYEIESHKNLFLVKSGTEYSFEISENFEIGLNLMYVNKETVYDNWVFGVAFNKKLWSKK